MYKIILALSIGVLITNSTNAQQAINPNIKHDWEDGRYIVNTDNTVLDNKTGLIWKKCTQGLSGSDCSTGSLTIHNWQQALDLASNSEFASFSDWRLPNIKELGSIAAYDRYNPAINSAIFPNTPTSYFWSSSPYANNSFYVWIMNFNYGNDNTTVREDGSYVRLVRGGKQGHPS